MKKAFALVVLIVTPTMAFAQGTVVFNNGSEFVVEYRPPPSLGVPAVARVELLTAPNGTSLTPLGTYVLQDTMRYFIPHYTSLSGFLAANPGWSDIVTVGTAPVAGRFNGGTFALPGIAGGATAEYVVIGWNGPANTFDQAMGAGAWIGSTPMLTTLTGNPATTPPGTAVFLLFPGLTLAPTPEPTSFALAGLGAVALMLFRRRR